VDETYRMLGREHEADLEREAQRRSLAAVAKATAAGREQPIAKSLWRTWLGWARSPLIRLQPSASDSPALGTTLDALRAGPQVAVSADGGVPSVKRRRA
jgi:hypothetical protein